MTFGNDWGWGAEEREAQRISIFIWTEAETSSTRRSIIPAALSERILGGFIAGKRDLVVLATKFTMSRDPKNPNSGQQPSAEYVRSLEQSLKQLNTDRIDLFYLHGWDFTTQPEEVMRGLDDLITAGKIHMSGSATHLPGVSRRCRRSPISAVGRRSSHCRSKYSSSSGPSEHEAHPHGLRSGLVSSPGRLWGAGS